MLHYNLRIASGLFSAEGRAAVDIFALAATVPPLHMLHGIYLYDDDGGGGDLQYTSTHDSI